MSSESSDQFSDCVDLYVKSTEARWWCINKPRGKIRKRLVKAERERLKREQLNKLFFELAHVLAPSPPNNGKASILCETTRVLMDLHGEIELLEKEKACLISETQYVMTEKKELQEEKSALKKQIDQMQREAEEWLANSKPDHDIPPKFHQSQAVLVVPFVAELHTLPPKMTSHVSKPVPRYLDKADTWPSQLIEQNQQLQ